jgi:hypothetical protein
MLGFLQEQSVSLMTQSKSRNSLGADRIYYLEKALTQAMAAERNELATFLLGHLGEIFDTLESGNDATKLEQDTYDRLARAAAQSGNVDMLKELRRAMRASSRNVNFDPDGALRAAAVALKMSAIEYLLGRGANVNAEDGGYTVMHAVLKENPNCKRALSLVFARLLLAGGRLSPSAKRGGKILTMAGVLEHHPNRVRLSVLYADHLREVARLRRERLLRAQALMSTVTATSGSASAASALIGSASLPRLPTRSAATT